MDLQLPIVELEERKSYQPQELRYRHLRIMDLMLGNPSMSQNEMAEELGMTASRLSIVVNSPLFKLAFSEYEKQHRQKLSDVIQDSERKLARNFVLKNYSLEKQIQNFNSLFHSLLKSKKHENINYRKSVGIKWIFKFFLSFIKEVKK